MDTTARQRADDRLEQALEHESLQDPREPFRDRLRWLKEHDPAAFEEARRFHEEVVIPGIAAGAEPLPHWLAFGRRLAELTGAGKLLEIEPGGRAWSASADPARDRLVVHLPEDLRLPALVLRRPRELAPSQQAACDLLIQRASR